MEKIVDLGNGASIIFRDNEGGAPLMEVELIDASGGRAKAPVTPKQQQQIASKMAQVAEQIVEP